MAAMAAATGKAATAGAQEVAFDSVAAEELVKELRVSFRTGASKGVRWREEQLRALERMIAENEDDVLKSLHKDLGRSDFISISAELNPLKNSVSEARKHLRKWMKHKQVSTNLLNLPGSSKIVPEPYGVVLIISPWNFPMSLSLDPLVGAIAAGNAVVLKPSEFAPYTSSLLARLAKAYLDEKFIRVVEGGISESTALLEQKWDKIFYTGSPKVGKIVAEAAAKHMTPCTLELGGKSPVIVDATVNLQVAANRIAFGKFFNGGHACVAADYVLVEETIASKLVDALQSVLTDWYGKEGSQSPDLQRIVDRKQFRRLETLLSDPRVAEKIIYGGQMSEKDLFIAPTLLRDAPWDSAIMTEEIFGPILPIQTVRNVGEAIEIVNKMPNPLVIYPFTKDAATAEHIIRETSSGGVCVNDCIMHMSNSALPFGGIGESGMGAYHGKHSFDCFSHSKAVLHKSFLLDINERYPPVTQYKAAFIKALQTLDFFALFLTLLGFRK